MSKTTPLLALLLASTPAFAQDFTPETLTPETLTIEKTIKAGPNMVVLDMGMNGGSPLYVLSADDLTMKGNMGSGTAAQMVLAGDAKTLYTASTYYKRYTTGAIEAVITEWDLPTLTAKREIPISEKMAQVDSQPALFALVDAEKYLLVQNATPATSVSVVDLGSGKQIAEIPTPGCWTAMPSAAGAKFTALCGDGTLMSWSFKADGTVAEPLKSQKIFDADQDALFANPIRLASGLLAYVSFKGSFYLVDDSGETPVLTATTPFAVEGWAPSGSEVLAYHAASDTAYVMMHPKAKEGTHKNPAAEIWAFEMGSGKLLARSPAGGETGIIVSKDGSTVFGATHDGGVNKYSVEAGKLTKTASKEGFMIFPTIMAADF